MADEVSFEKSPRRGASERYSFYPYHHPLSDRPQHWLENPKQVLPYLQLDLRSWDLDLLADLQSRHILQHRSVYDKSSTVSSSE
eukprot:4071919-Amphidinium_carterae.2